MDGFEMHNKLNLPEKLTGVPMVCVSVLCRRERERMENGRIGPCTIGQACS